MKSLSIANPYPNFRPVRKPDAVIELNLPPETSHPNARPGNWRAKAHPAKKHAEASGEIVWSHAMELGTPRWKAVTIRLTFMLLPLAKRGSDKRHDPDNLISWSKKSLDLLAKHGILDDDRDVIYLPPVQLRANKSVVGFEMSKPGLKIEVWKRTDGECPFCGAALTDGCKGG